MQEAVTLPITSPTLVGRADHLVKLHSLLDETKDGVGRVARISGEAGIGKSRLVNEVKTYATQQGFLTLQGQCFPADHNCPYAPLLDLLRSLSASRPSPAIITAIQALARDVFPLLPELVPDQEITRSPLEPEQEKRRLFAVLTTFFHSFSPHTPILVIIEDVHWSDATSLEFLHYLIRRTTARPLLLLVTYRHDEVSPALGKWLTQLDRERLDWEIRLALLSRNDTDTMLSAIFDQRHTSLDMRRFLHGELLQVLYTLTDGNPFFVEETLSSLIAAKNIFFAQGYWNRISLNLLHIPRSIQDVVQQRTEHIHAEARYILMLAAVAGRHFDFVLLQRVTGYDEDQLLGYLKELLAAQLVVEESAEQFAFRHALIREAIYTQLLARERLKLHLAIAETLEQLSLDAPSAYLEKLAVHFYHAHAWVKAMDYAQRAGEKALRLYAHLTAIDYFTWALDAAQQLSLPLPTMIVRARGQAYEMLGDFEKARQDYTLALNSAQALQDRQAEWQSAMDLGFLWVGRDYTQAEPWFRQALTLTQALHDPALRAHSLNRIGNWHLNVEQPREALRYHQEALTMFQELQDTDGIAKTLDLLGMVSYIGGDLMSGTIYYQQAIPLFEALNDQQGLTSSIATLTLRGPTYQTDTLISAASLEEVSRDAERALKIARDIGQRSAEAYALFQLALCLGSQGEYTRALAIVQKSLDIADEIEHRQWQAAAHTVLGGIYSSMLALVQAREQFELALSLAHEMSSLFWTFIAAGYLTSACIQLNDFPSAEQVLRSTLKLDTPAQTMAQRMVWCAEAELALAHGSPERALEIIAEIVAADAHLVGQGLRIAKLRGEALLALQRLPEALEAIQAAQAIALAQGVRPMQWRLYSMLGTIYHAQGQDAEAEQAFTLARTLIEEIAIALTDEVLRNHFQQQATTLPPRTQPSAPVRKTKQGKGGLTEREQEVALLIAQGKSNQAISEILIVTRRTVETHISNIMFKLNCTSRTQIALWTVEAGLIDKAQ